MSDPTSTMTADEIDRQMYDRHMRMQCLDMANKLHSGAYDGVVVVKTAKMYYDFAMAKENNNAA